MTGTLLLLALGCGPEPDAVAPDSPAETCNGRDDDCDGAIDEDALDREWRYVDDDRDGHGVGEAVLACAGAWATADRAGDCDDADPEVYPGAAEICGDGRINDCGATVGCRHVGDLSFDDVAIFSVIMDYGQSNAFTGAAGVGDVDGDGLDDVVLGAGYQSFVEEADGGVFLYRGRSAPASVTLAESDAILVGPEYHAVAGNRVAAAGDVDADGLADVLVEPGASALDVWLLQGPVISGALADVATVLPTGFDRWGEWSGEGSEQRVAGPGDVDGDGYDDLLYVEDRTSETGEVYLQRGPVPPGVTRHEAYASWYGDPDSVLGWVVERVGDLDGDGRPELAMSALSPAGSPPMAGAIYLVSEPAPGRHHMSEADVVLRGGNDYEGAGIDLAGGEDIDADGYGDLLVAAPTREGWEGSYPPTQLTAAWLVGGGLTGDHALADVAIAEVRVVHGTEARWGASVAMPGDLDADGFGDVAIGLSRITTTTASGLVALYYGPVAGTHDYTDADARLWGTHSWGLPATPGNLDAAGDFDGDGIPDLLIGARDGANLDARVPAAWVIPGAAW